MTCESCTPGTTHIHTPTELTTAIRHVAEKVRSTAWLSIGAGPYGDPFRELAHSEDWGDLVNNYFRCTSCNQLWHLHAETWHGRGGALEPVDSTPDSLRSAAI